jgi:hypothetical protein
MKKRYAVVLSSGALLAAAASLAFAQGVHEAAQAKPMSTAAGLTEFLSDHRNCERLVGLPTGLVAEYPAKVTKALVSQLQASDAITFQNAMDNLHELCRRQFSLKN